MAEKGDLRKLLELSIRDSRVYLECLDALRDSGKALFHARDNRSAIEIASKTDRGEIDTKRRHLCYLFCSGIGLSVAAYKSDLVHAAIDLAIGHHFEIDDRFFQTLWDAFSQKDFNSNKPAMTADERALWEATEAFSQNGLYHEGHVDFLTKLSSGRSSNNVQAFAGFLKSAFSTRIGDMANAQEAMQAARAISGIDENLKLTLFVEDMNQKFISIPRTLFAQPQWWDVVQEFPKIEDYFGVQSHKYMRGNADLADRDLSEILGTVGVPFLHTSFFNFQAAAADARLNQPERRMIWDQQLQLQTRALHPDIGGKHFSRPIWNQLLVAIVQAHKFGDFDYRDALIDRSLGLDGTFFAQSDLAEDFAARSRKLDHSYVMYVLLLNTLGVKKDVPGLHIEDRLENLLSRRSSIKSYQSKVALDTFRKRHGLPARDDDIIRDYLPHSHAFENYVLDVAI